MSDNERPYRTLGWQLKLMREQLSQTLAEVSGAVEIEAETLELIEQGRQRPNEEILFLLISHFDIKDPEANSLWELAGYTDAIIMSKDELPLLTSSHDKSVTIALPIDPRVIYTDHVHVNINDYGVVLNFLQNSGFSKQSFPVARVGMSREHARKVLDVLKQSLDQIEAPKQPKLLPRVRNRSKTDNRDQSGTN